MAQDVITKKVINLAKQFNPADLAQLAKRVPVVRKSNSVAYTDTTAINLFELPGNVYIKDIQVRVTTPFDASGSSAAASANITVPNDTGTETLWSSAAGQIQATGFIPSTTRAVTPASGGMVILNYTAGTTTAGALEVYLEYVQYDSEL